MSAPFMSAWRLWSLDLAPEGALGVMQTGADRADAAADGRRDLLVAHLLDEAEQQYFALLVREAVERRVNEGRGFAVEGDVGGVIIRGGDVGGVVHRDDAHDAAAAEHAVGAIAGDAIEPGGEGAGVLQAADRAQQVEPDVLERIVGGMGARR